MKHESQGIHHITALSADAQRTLDFYAGTLGLRFVKKTVNHDDPETYHLYFGNHEASPGTLLTFFPQTGAQRGKIGAGQVGTIRLAIPPHSNAFWKKRLKEHGVPYRLEEGFHETRLAFADPDGLSLELVESDIGKKNLWRIDDIGPDTAIKGIHSVLLHSAHPDKTRALLEFTFGFRRMGIDKTRVRMHSTEEIGGIVDIDMEPPERGRQGAGTGHHIAFRAQDGTEQEHYRETLSFENYRTSPLIDRKYFRSLYFRECGYILFEIATDGPGFTVDENLTGLATTLTLPASSEREREHIEKVLPPLDVRTDYVRPSGDTAE